VKPYEISMGWWRVNLKKIEGYSANVIKTKGILESLLNQSAKE
jgi:hypothetical protein